VTSDSRGLVVPQDDGDFEEIARQASRIPTMTMNVMFLQWNRATSAASWTRARRGIWSCGTAAMVSERLQLLEGLRTAAQWSDST
jgi:hypothetical protein